MAGLGGDEQQDLGARERGELVGLRVVRRKLTVNKGKKKEG